MGEIAQRNPREMYSAAFTDQVQSEGDTEPKIQVLSKKRHLFVKAFVFISRPYSPATKRSRSKNDMRQPGGQLREEDDDQQADELE